MFTTRSFRHLVWGALVLGASHAQGQATTPGNSGGPLDFLGWDAGTPQALEVRHDGNQRIEWYTDALHRMGLYPNVNNTVNGYTINQTGYFGLSDEPAFFTGSGPFSKIHLVEAMGSTNPVNYAQVLGFRDWMRNGVTMTGNSDQCYIGAKYNEDDNSDLVLQWSDNPEDAIYGTDRLRFLFTNRRSTSGALFGARSEEGLESFRVFVEDDFNANVGIGDFFRESVLTASVVDPTERLDVLDGRVRIRELPLVANQNETLNKYMVVDDNGVVQWRTIAPGSIGTNSCEWELNPGVFQMATAYRTATTAAACTDRRWRLGVGISTPVYKVDIYHDESFQTVSGGLRVQLFTGLGGRRGIFCKMSPVGGGSLPNGIAAFHELTGVTGGSNGSIGRVSLNLPNANTLAVGARGDVYTTAGSSVEVIGVSGYASTTAPGSVTKSYGVKGESEGSAGAIGSSYGVYGRATANVGALNYSIYGESAGTGTNDWAGYFNGRTYVAGSVFVPSDENLKSGIEPLGNATERLLQLDPKTYLFRVDEFPTMGLPQEQQYGFLATELQAIFPEMVIETTHPASYDSSGVELTPAIPFKAVSLGGLTSVLVAAFQEQQATIAELNDRLAQMESRLDGCCSGSPSDGRSNATEEGTGNSSTIGNNRTLRIVPNPMQNQATIHYQLERSGRMQLLVNSNDGKELRVLKEANTEAGTYQYEWATEGLAPGVYYVTLLLDGQPLTKQVIKIDR